MMNSPHRIDTPGEIADLLAFGVVFVLAGLLIGGTIITVNPRLDEQLRYQVTAPPQYDGGEVVFTREQIGHLNKAYRESAEEQGRCLEIEGNRVDELNYPLDTANDTRTQTSFECPPRTNGVVHTHPGLLAIPELSATDREALLNSDLELSCVISDPVPSSTTRNPVSMGCFTRSVEQTVVRIVDRPDR
jgi:hypothetical protein